MTQVFATSFLDEMEKIGGRRQSSPRAAKLNVPHLKLEVALPAAEAAAPKKRSKWGRRLGLLLGKFIKRRVLAKQGVPAIRIK